MTQKNFPNGFTSWCETHFEICANIGIALANSSPFLPDRLEKVHQEKGHGGMYELAEELTDKFEEKYKDREWDGDFFDTIEEFIEEEFTQ